MKARTMWKAIIQVDTEEIPVRLYAAATDHTIRFRLLHKKDKAPVEQRMVHGDTGKEVEREDWHKGAKIDSDRFVLLKEADLDHLEPPSSRVIAILRFVARRELGHEWYNRPYYLGPDGDESAYWAFAQALANSGKEGIARWVMRKKEYVGALTTLDGYLALMTLRYAEEVVQPKEIGIPPNSFDSRELKMAEQLMALLESDFDASRYRDDFRDRVVKLIETKASGGSIAPKRATPKKQPSSLAGALKASIAAAQKPAKKKSNGKN